MVGRPYQRIDEVAHNIMLEVDKRQDVCYYMFMIKTPQNTNIPQQILYNSGKKSMGFRKANEASDSEVRRAGFGRIAKKAGAVAVIAIAALGSLKAAESLQESVPSYPTVKGYEANPGGFPDFEKTVIQPGDTAFGIAEETQPDSDNRKVSDLLIAEDKANETDGIGHPGFDAGDPLIVHKAPTEK